MDPLSLTVATITLLQTATSIIQICYDYRSGLKDAPKDVARLTGEVASLIDVLESLTKLSKRGESVDTLDGGDGIDASAQSRLPALKLLLKPDGPLDQCTTELETLKEKLTAPTTGWKTTSFGRAVCKLKWPMTEQDITNTLGKIERLNTIFNLALTTDQTTIALATQGHLTRLTQSFSSYTLDEHQQKIYQWLLAPDPSSNHNNACGKRKGQPTTGSWFINSEQFDHWKTSSNSMLWLYGIPGCGKTILCSTIIEDVISHCLLNPKLTTAYFYFDFNDKERQKHENLIRSLITQLSMQNAKPLQALEALYAANQNGLRQPSYKGLVETLIAILGLSLKTYIILDALDECTDREELLGLVQEMNELRMVQILATSRKEKDIEEVLKPLVTCQICIQDAQFNDIQLHIRHQLKNDRKLKIWPLKVQEEIEKSLMDGAHGMFRWVVCQLDALRKCMKLDKLRETLKSLPKDLDETYSRILDNIDKEGYSEDAFKILQWLAYSSRPLLIEEMVEVIAVDIEDNARFNPENRLLDPQYILIMCSGLVVTAASELRLAHFSVKEYLVSGRVRTRYKIAESAHSNIAQTCLIYLLHFKGPYLLTSDNVDEFPLVRYAAKYWTRHSRMARNNMDQTDRLSIELFRSKTDAYINWIRLSDPNRPWFYQPDMAMNLESIPPQLYYASLEGLIELARQLIMNGANVNTQGGEYSNALQAASAKGYDHIVQLLLKKEADVNAQGGMYGNALQAASAEGHSQIIQLLLENGANVNAKGGQYSNALQAASYRGQGQIVQLLLEKGADINTQEGQYGGALQAASAGGQGQIVQLLLEKGANINAQGGQYGGALQAASAGDHSQIVQLLLEKGPMSMREEEGTATHCRWLQLGVTARLSSYCSRMGPTSTHKEEVTATRYRRLHIRATARLSSYYLRRGPTSTHKEEGSAMRYRRL